jgi:hypothetical protein
MLPEKTRVSKPMLEGRRRLIALAGAPARAPPAMLLVWFVVGAKLGQLGQLDRWTRIMAPGLPHERHWPLRGRYPGRSVRPRPGRLSQMGARAPPRQLAARVGEHRERTNRRTSGRWPVGDDWRRWRSAGRFFARQTGKNRVGRRKTARNSLVGDTSRSIFRGPVEGLLNIGACRHPGVGPSTQGPRPRPKAGARGVPERRTPAYKEIVFALAVRVSYFTTEIRSCKKYT